ncbi:MAG: hypothetical protein EPN84_00220 [Legionella sp.]|nr:MAG: hypothetical protein EPN84_00220 [Legionella sp.]
MFPVLFNCEYDKKNSTLRFYPHPRIGQIFNLNGIDLLVRDWNAGSIVIVIRGLSGHSDVAQAVIEKFIGIDGEKYGTTEFGTLADPTNPAAIFYMGRFDTEGLAVKREDAIETVKDFFKSVFKVLNVDNDSKRKLDTALNDILHTKDFQFTDVAAKPVFFPKKPVKVSKTKLPEPSEMDSDADADADAAESYAPQ